MDVELKTKLVEALRSGKYQQGQRALLNCGCYCCLGVLCDLMGAEWEGGDGDQSAMIDGEESRYFLEGSATAVSGLTREQQERLAKMNDEGKPFTEIADYIEQSL